MMRGYGFGGYGGGMFNPFAGFLTMGFGLLLFALLVILVVWLLVRATKHGQSLAGMPEAHTPQTAPPGDPALEIARERYARGEIDEEQYGRLVSNLK